MTPDLTRREFLRQAGGAAVGGGVARLVSPNEKIILAPGISDLLNTLGP